MNLYRNVFFRTRLFIALAAIATAFSVLTGCSSVPKRAPEVFTNRNAAIAQLELANKAITKGDYTNAYLFLDEAWRLAVGTDDPETRIRVQIAKGNALFNQGKRSNAIMVWTNALVEAAIDKNESLISTCKIYIARGDLAEGTVSDGMSVEERQRNALTAKKIAENEMGKIKDNPLYTAFAWKVIGLSEKELGQMEKAVDAIKNAADIHEKACYLEDTAYDWYLISSIYSKARHYDNALDALQKALDFDRRAENSNGLGMDWMAIGMVQEKAGNTEFATLAYRRAKEIFQSAFITQNAAEAESKLAAITNRTDSGASRTTADKTPVSAATER